ncbi:hypothetical protein [Chiayiivirga flava]|uniref:Uncharacterized protein n=1 Tax=Chiayiivirga flava TaxID=659595 RepID=A0A7W8D6M0_9GAMM|nr:hypothetical protein [Chiayiivirga flava]MBB5208497.1 hypothetical protein [Chiayiivirga flava]
MRRFAVPAALVLCVCAAIPPLAAAQPRADAVADASTHGTLVLRPNADVLRGLGIELAGGLVQGDTRRFGIAPRAPLTVELRDGGPTAVGDTPIALPALVLRRADGVRSPPLSLRSADGGVRRWRVVDDAGAVWLRITQAMRSPDGASALSLLTSDMRVGPALAAWAGDVAAAGLPFANAELHLPLRLRAADKSEAAGKSCTVPNWPGTPGFVTDVILTNIDDIDVMRCRNLSDADEPCDGPGGAPGELVVVPSVTLRNSSAANASEVPWYTKFTGNFPPYDNDQHPFLVWNLYRLDAEGRIDQIARSGLKHAFATANDACVEPCNNQHILGRGCEDLYNSFSNDANAFLSPRREVIPSRGIWGRCGSVFDDGLDALGVGTPGCDSAQDAAPANDGYRERMVVRESDLDPALHAGAEYLVDSWYVVRDDIDLFNTMGSRALVPVWFGTRWDLSGSPPAYTQGSVLDRWLERAPAGVVRQRRLIETAEGRVLVAVRVHRNAEARYVYDYAIMNYDLTRPITSGAEPDLQVLRNHGLAQITLALLHGATVDVHDYRDGDASAANDWPGTVGADAVAWEAPDAQAYLEWGSLVTLRLESAAAPGPGLLQLAMAEAGMPAFQTASVLVPDASQLFRDGFD